MITLRGLKKQYGEKVLFDGVDLTFPDGEITCVMGASGSGKTTLLNVLAGLTDYEGEVGGVARDAVGYVFQTPRLIPALTVLENLTYVGISEPDALRALAETEMAQDAKKYPPELSGGMAQRVGMSRAFASGGEVLLMDEPYRNLDLALRARLVALLGRIVKSNPRTVVYVTHDVDEAAAVSRRVLILNGGKVTAVTTDHEPTFDLGEVDEDFRKRVTKALMSL